ncbi:hypothetical protein BKA62DRAFT_722233 [Auriculariales sp. MPI-PUGE-AT-0066]|nr:hypothetical protein BKA62DRAFT_722233 [Auriculariales sp. MPI-PUGE-AT-0066]
MRVSLQSFGLLLLLGYASAAVLSPSPARRADDAAQTDAPQPKTSGFVLIGDSTTGLINITTVDPNATPETSDDTSDGTGADAGDGTLTDGTTDVPSSDGTTTDDTTDVPPSIRGRQDPADASTNDGTGDNNTSDPNSDTSTDTSTDTTGDDSTDENSGPKTVLVSGGWSATFCSALWEVDPSHCLSFATEAPKYLTAQDSLNLPAAYPAAIQQIKTFIAQGVTPVYVPIQFGNDDEHEGVSPETMSHMVQTMVQGVKAAGGTPVLLTPLSKRVFKEDHEKINATRRPFARAILNVALVEKVLAIDTHWSSLRLCEDEGYDKCTSWNLTPDDDTYLNDEGRIIFGRLIASELKMVLPLGTLPLDSDWEHDEIIDPYVMLGLVAKPVDDASVTLKPGMSVVSAAFCVVLALVSALH